MKKMIVSMLLLSLSSLTQAQVLWNETGNNLSSGNLTIGSTVASSYSKLVIKGPNQPANSGSKRDVSFEFASAGKAQIRAYRGGSWDTYLQFLTNPIAGGTPITRMHISQNGRVGIGTTNPIDKFTINGGDMTIGNATNQEYNIWFRPSDNNARSSIIGYSSNIVANDYIGMKTRFGSIRFITNAGNEIVRITDNERVGIGTSNPKSILSVGSIMSTMTSNTGITLGSDQKSIELLHSSSSNGYGSKFYGVDEGAGVTSLRLAVRGNSTSWTDAIYVKANNTNGLGFVGIGTNTPDSKLTVAGKIHSQEVKVTVNAGADFVFDKSYKLRSLEQIETFINRNNHLPDIQSEKEMLIEGLELGDMNIKLLQKVEELTLYLIEQNKEIEQLKEKVSRLEK